MKQTVKATRAAATRTCKSRERSKGAYWKEARLARLKKEQIGCAGSQRAPNKRHGYPWTYCLRKSHAAAKLTRLCFDMKHGNVG